MTNQPVTSAPVRSAASAPAPRLRWLRRLVPVLAVAGVLSMSTACTPAELIAVFDKVGYDHSAWTQDDYRKGAEWSAQFWAAVLAGPVDKYRDVLSDEQLARLRQCEAGGSYTAVGGGGRYRGGYQFSQSTWDGVAARNYPDFAGIDPAGAAPAIQDAMARALWSERGPQPWPVCGYRV